MNGKQVRLFLVEGTTGSLMTAEIMNWTGHLISAPRSELADLLLRPEVQGTGIYFLIGDDEEGVYDSRVYIGEGDAVDVRLRAHSRPQESGGRDFWNRVVVVTSKDANITKAHARYLESRLIALTRSANRSVLENSTNPPDQLLPEADRSDMEYFIAQLRIVLPVLGVQALRQTAARSRRPVQDVIAMTGEHAEVESLTESGPVLETAEGPSSPVFRLRVARSPDRYALAQEVDAEFIVKAGSFAKPTSGVMVPGYEAKRDSLIKSGLLAPSPDSSDVLALSENYVFRSPSEAASVMNGSSENGRTRWVTEDGMSYGTWQRRRVTESDPI